MYTQKCNTLEYMKNLKRNYFSVDLLELLVTFLKFLWMVLLEPERTH